MPYYRRVSSRVRVPTRPYKRRAPSRYRRVSSRVRVPRRKRRTPSYTRSRRNVVKRTATTIRSRWTPLVTKNFSGQDRITFDPGHANGSNVRLYSTDVGPMDTTATFDPQFGGGSIFRHSRVHPQWNLFERWQLDSIAITYTPRLGTSTDGTLHMGFDYDPTDVATMQQMNSSRTAPTFIQALAASPSYASGPVYAPLTVQVVNRPLGNGEMLFPVKFTSPGEGLHADQDTDRMFSAIRQCNCALLHLAFDGVPDTVPTSIGDLTIRYKIRFYSPTQETTPSTAASVQRIATSNAGIIVESSGSSTTVASVHWPNTTPNNTDLMAQRENWKNTWVRMYMGNAEGQAVTVRSDLLYRAKVDLDNPVVLSGTKYGGFHINHADQRTPLTGTHLIAMQMMKRHLTPGLDTESESPNTMMFGGDNVNHMLGTYHENRQSADGMYWYMDDFAPLSFKVFYPFTDGSFGTIATDVPMVNAVPDSSLLGRQFPHLEALTSPPDSLEAGGAGAGVWKAMEETVLVDGTAIPGALVPQGTYTMDPSRIVLLHNTGTPWSGLQYANGDAFTGSVLLLRGASLVKSYSQIGLTTEFGLTSIMPATNTVSVGSMKDIHGRDVHYETPSAPGSFQITGDFYYIQ